MPELHEQLRTARPNRYVIEPQIGAGGIAVVYRAREFADGYVRSGAQANVDVFPTRTEFVFVKRVIRERPRRMGIANRTSELPPRAQAATSPRTTATSK